MYVGDDFYNDSDIGEEDSFPGNDIPEDAKNLKYISTKIPKFEDIYSYQIGILLKILNGMPVHKAELMCS